MMKIIIKMLVPKVIPVINLKNLPGKSVFRASGTLYYT